MTFQKNDRLKDTAFGVCSSLLISEPVELLQASSAFFVYQKKYIRRINIKKLYTDKDKSDMINTNAFSIDCDSFPYVF